MRIVYLSITGNIRKFVKEIGIEDVIELSYSNPFIEVNEDFVLIIPSYDDAVTEFFCNFIEYKNNSKHLVGIVGSGNRNFGEDGYCFSAVDISKKYDKPLLMKFEFSGTEEDRNKFKKEVNSIAIARTNQKD